jgi:uncharacterized membrane protein
MRLWSIVSLVVALAALASSLYVVLHAPDLLPANFPVHWNFEGKVDRTAPREEAWIYLLIMPEVMTLLTGLTLVLPWLSPRKFNPERFRATYDFIMGVIVVLMGYLHTIILLASMEWKLDIGRWIAGGMFLFFAILGNVLGKVRRNFWVGVRTPWTLASEMVWNQTHRFTAWLWAAMGVVGFVCALAGVPLIMCFVGVMVAALAPVLYSLILYKRLESIGRLKEEAPEVSDPVA